ncbi:hypothetical protein EG328_008428 [Venturia inaequalis]|uniref:Uncharacterized protein n=1 Tax=Venturia inaequalis TaxID=5025 RepID=A0A8H3UD16_VENIN|nr:hypothetical protein EG328_008428 [Venturia inaequalis]
MNTINVYDSTWQTMDSRVSSHWLFHWGVLHLHRFNEIVWNATHVSNEKDGKPEKESLRAAALSTCLQVVLGIIPIIETEMTMRVNNIQMGETLSSSEQLILLSVSIFLFVATVRVGLKNLNIGASHLPFRVL